MITSKKTIALIFIIAFIGYLANLPTDIQKSLKTGTYRRLITSYDTVTPTFLPYSIIKEQQLYFSTDLLDAMKKVHVATMSSVMEVNGHHVSAYPILAGVMALPVYFVPVFYNVIPQLFSPKQLVALLSLGRITASFYTACSVVLFYLILLETLKYLNKKVSKWTYFFLIFYAFGTNLYVTASRSLWQHTSSLFFISLAVLFLLKGLRNPKYIKWIGLLCGFVYIARPSNIIFVLIVSLYVFVKHRAEFWKYLLFSLPTVFLLLSYNYFILGSALTSEYIIKGDASFTTPILQGLIGNLFSPPHSFLFVSPPLVLSFYGIIHNLLQKKKSEFEVLLSFLGISFLGALVLYSMWWAWDGADSFGYRFFTEWLPIVGVFTYLISFPFHKLGKNILVVLMLLSIVIQLNAVLFRKARCTAPTYNWSFYCHKPLFFTKLDY